MERFQFRNQILRELRLTLPGRKNIIEGKASPKSLNYLLRSMAWSGTKTETVETVSDLARDRGHRAEATVLMRSLRVIIFPNSNGVQGGLRGNDFESTKTPPFSERDGGSRLRRYRGWIRMMKLQMAIF